MKLVLTQYLQSLKERGELEKVLPDILSERGFNIVSRPGIGAHQAGVDVAAVGSDDDGVLKLFLYSIKAGDLDRATWNTGTQALRPSLDEILDDYIPHRIEPQYRHLPIVVCACIGGEIKENVRSNLSGYADNKSTEKISVQFWNGDRLAEIIMSGMLREEFLPQEIQTDFRKAVGFIDEPDVTRKYFEFFTKKLVANARQANTVKGRLRMLRQLNLCVWVLFGWGRRVNNLRGPLEAAELAVLAALEILRGQNSKRSQSWTNCLELALRLTFSKVSILDALISEKVEPHRHAAHFFAVNSRGCAAVDVNLRLFELLGWVALDGLWCVQLKDAYRNDGKALDDLNARARDRSDLCFDLIENNPILHSPLRDDHSIEIALVLCLLVSADGNVERAAKWIDRIVVRLIYTFNNHREYPCNFTEYRDLARHPRDGSKDYFEDATSASTLIPLLACFCSGLGLDEQYRRLKELQDEVLPHCTLQLWLPGGDTEEHLFSGNRNQGIALTGIRLENDEQAILRYVFRACEDRSAIDDFQSIKLAWPMFLFACRRHRFPVPPHFWIGALQPSQDSQTDNPVS